MSIEGMFDQLAMKDALIHKQSKQLQGDQIYYLGSRDINSGKFKVESELDSYYANKLTNADVKSGDLVAFRKDGASSFDSKPAVSFSAKPGFSATNQTGNTTLGKRNTDRGYLNGQIFSIPQPKKKNRGSIRYAYSILRDLGGLFELSFYVGGDGSEDKLIYKESSTDDTTFFQPTTTKFGILNNFGQAGYTFDFFQTLDSTKYSIYSSSSGNIQSYTFPFTSGRYFFGNNFTYYNSGILSGDTNFIDYFISGSIQRGLFSSLTNQITDMPVSSKVKVSGLTQDSGEFNHILLAHSRQGYVVGIYGFRGGTANGTAHPYHVTDQYRRYPDYPIADFLLEMQSALGFVLNGVFNFRDNNLFIDIISRDKFSHIVKRVPLNTVSFGNFNDPTFNLFDRDLINTNSQKDIMQRVDIYDSKTHKKLESKTVKMYAPRYQDPSFQFIWASYAE